MQYSIPIKPKWDTLATFPLVNAIPIGFKFVSFPLGQFEFGPSYCSFPSPLARVKYSAFGTLLNCSYLTIQSPLDFSL